MSRPSSCCLDFPAFGIKAKKSLTFVRSGRCFDIEKMFGLEYVQGYTAALLDVRVVLENIETDLKIHKRKQNLKTMKQIIDCMIKSRVVLRENPKAFVRCNDTADGGFEIYIEGHEGCVKKI